MLVVSIGAALVLALVLWRQWARLRAIERAVHELRLLRREIEDARDEGARELAVTRAHVAAVAAGVAPGRDTILRGLPYEDVDAAEALRRWERGEGLVVLDVRTPAEFAEGHIPDARLVPLDQLERRLDELPPHDAALLVTCAAGGRSAAACRLLAERGWTRLANLAGGMLRWSGPRVRETPPPPAPAGADGGVDTAVSYRGGPISGEQVVGAIRECFDPEIPLNVYDLGLIYGIDIGPEAIAVRMTLTSEGCPSARAIPEEVKRRIVALGQPNVSVDVVWEPPWHPSRISPDGKVKLGLA
jgi:metal-sulfur cluster biosynthetic enzyme/rhodanese-related sulfurtransferase